MHKTEVEHFLTYTIITCRRPFPLIPVAIFKHALNRNNNCCNIVMYFAVQQIHQVKRMYIKYCNIYMTTIIYTYIYYWIFIVAIIFISLLFSYCFSCNLYYLILCKSRALLSLFIYFRWFSSPFFTSHPASIFILFFAILLLFKCKQTNKWITIIGINDTKLFSPTFTLLWQNYFLFGLLF